MGDGELRTLAYGHDGLGSIRAVVSHGTVQEQYHYDAFGKPFGDELETDERGYNGKPYDAVLGHYNYGYRDYDPLTGRFATVDPVRDGRNWYVYTANDPVNFIDPWGLAAEDAIKEEYLRGIGLRYDRDDKTFEWTSNGTGQSTPIDDAFAGAIPGFDPPKDRNFFQRNAPTTMPSPVKERRRVRGVDFVVYTGVFKDEQGGLWERDLADVITDIAPSFVLNLLKKLHIKMNYHDNDNTTGFRGIKGTPTEGMQIYFNNETKERVTGEFQGTYDYGDSYKTHKKYDINPHNENSDYRKF